MTPNTANVTSWVHVRRPRLLTNLQENNQAAAKKDQEMAADCGDLGDLGIQAGKMCDKATRSY
jgi:hypothetical protein